MAKRLYYDINTETGKWFDSSNPTYLLSSDKKPKLKLGEKVILCLSLFDNTGTALVLNNGDTFDIGADNNYNHTDDLCLYADNTAVDVAGDWDDIDRATGKISIRLTIDSVSLRTKLSTSETLSSVKIQLRRFESGTGDQSDYLLDEITLQNVVILDEAAPDQPDPTYLLKAEAYAMMQAGREFQFSVNGSTLWHDTQVEADRYYRERYPDGEWSVAILMVAGPQGIQGIQGIQGEDGPEVMIQYSITGSSLWHSTFTDGDLYQRVSTDGGVTWGNAILFVADVKDDQTFTNAGLVNGILTVSGVVPVAAVVDENGAVVVAAITYATDTTINLSDFAPISGTWRVRFAQGGSTGPQGVQGVAGSAATIAVGTVTTGAAGSSASVTNSGTTSVAVLDFTIPRGNTGATGATGANGADGADGKTILSGTAAPTTEGVDGDFYLRTTTSMLYGPKAGGVWPSGTSLKGDMTNPMTASGDIIYGGTSGAPARLAKGTDGQVLKLANGVPSWADESAGGGGMWTLVERWEPSQSATSHTFSGLDGNTDRRYKIVSRIKGGSANSVSVSVTCNSDTTASHYPYRYATSLSGQFFGWSGNNNSGFNLGYTDSTSALSFGDATLDALSGAQRAWRNLYTQMASDVAAIYDYHAAWYDNAPTPHSSNITQLVVTSNVSGGIGVGSYIELWKLAQ